MRLEITQGATLVDYELPDHTDKPRKLSVLQGDDPMILTLNRGFYCPKDRMQLLELARFSKQCAVGYTRLVTITTDNLLQSNDLRADRWRFEPKLGGVTSFAMRSRAENSTSPESSAALSFYRLSLEVSPESNAVSVITNSPKRGPRKARARCCSRLTCCLR